MDKVQNHILQYTIKNIQLLYNIKYKKQIARYTQYTMYNLKKQRYTLQYTIYIVLKYLTVLKNTKKCCLLFIMQYVMYEKYEKSVIDDC